jgi:hypothetical protein
VALVFFTALAAASLKLALLGESSCGCFGRLKVNPWLTFALDAAAVVGLAFVRPAAAPEGAPGWVRGLLNPLAGAGAILLLAGGAFFLLTPDPWSALSPAAGGVYYGRAARQ